MLLRPKHCSKKIDQKKRKIAADAAAKAKAIADAKVKPHQHQLLQNHLWQLYQMQKQ
jgi:hypothetical protein